MADQLFKKRQGKRQKRKEAIRKIAPFRWLIVCEGEKTEPNYFEGIKNSINKEYRDKIVIEGVEAMQIEINGTGRNTQNLVEYALEKRKNATIPYGHVWCVFDKDSFTDEQFNNAIQQCEDRGMKVAWSNESIELWFILHFEYLDAAIDRNQYVEKLDERFKKLSVNKGKYEKNLKNIYEILKKYGNLERAIKNAKKLETSYVESDTPSKKNPLTKVYLLVEELFECLEESWISN